MDLNLRGKKALVTGSTKGIGFSIAKLLAAEGASVVVNGRSQTAVDEAVAAIKNDFDAEVSGVAADGGTADGVQKVISAVPEVDILVNNLGIYEVKEFADITDSDWQRLFEVNVMSGIRLSRHYFPQMLKKNAGRIIFISSESAVHIPAEMIHYGFTKTAQVAIARGMAEMTVGTNVTVNSVLVGPTKSEGVEQFVRSVAEQKKISEREVEAEFFETMRPTSLIKRFATTEEVADMIAFLASDRSSATNGAAIRAEGGCIKAIL
jgi:NAD(P)-dependent dehydrogenase (short-subunit alcohol dehydrogenase family)